MSRAIATELPADRAGVNAAVPIPATRLPERVAPTPRPRPRPADHRQPDPRGSPVLLRAAALTEAHAVRDAGRFAAALPFLDASVDVGDRRRVCATSGDEDHVQRAVESAVAASVEAVADRLSGGGGDRGAASEPRERRLASDSAAV